MTPRAILFDKDGTLFDFQKSWGRWADGLIERFAPDPATGECLADAISYDRATQRFRPESIAIAGTAADIAQAWLPYLPDQTVGTMVRQFDGLAAEVVMAEALPLAPYLDRLLARGLKLAVVTNESEAVARQQLETAGIDGRIGFLAGYDSGYGAKPAPGPCLAAAKALGVPPAAAVMVGDSRHDLTAGRAAGMATIGVLTGLATRADLEPLADAVFPDIGHVPQWLAAKGA